MKRNFKPFWKSKTIVIAIISTITLILDYSFGWGIGPTINERIQSVFSSNSTGEIDGINFVALLSLAFAVAMRFISSSGVTFSQKKADQKEKDQIIERNNSLPDRIKMDVIAHNLKRAKIGVKK